MPAQRYYVAKIPSLSKRDNTVHALLRTQYFQLSLTTAAAMTNNNDNSDSDDRRVTHSSVFRFGMGMTGILSFLALANHFLGTTPDDDSSSLQHQRLGLRNDYKTVVARVPQPLKVRGQYDETLKDDAATMSFADAVNLEKFNFINSCLAGNW
jgi:Arc/MetJ family transcription regulator